MPAPSDFTLRGPDDFVRLDGVCAELLQGFRAWLSTPAGGSLERLAAGTLAHDADRYLRDFVVDILESGPGDRDPELLRRYLGNWYIVNTLEPSHAELDRICEALGRLYPYLETQGIASPAVVRGALAALADRQHFHDRLEAFWSLTPEAVTPWRAVDDYRRRRLGN